MVDLSIVTLVYQRVSITYLHHMAVFGQHEHTSPLIPATATAGEVIATCAMVQTMGDLTNQKGDLTLFNQQEWESMEISPEYTVKYYRDTLW